MANTGDYSWGHLASTEHFGRESKNYLTLNRNDLQEPLYKDCTQAAHCMFYARSEKKIFDVYDPRMIILGEMGDIVVDEQEKES
ncbi:hypothetical protein PR048_010631 [Dryococelus australis]|uniref:Uncharacterized protein n=1 Tax=Dryococelus australis TaxID=614101 RepID=A0ABQ9I3A4_9NEOP|nr:hypothetical protein PR048_010631 [Dryococelus australis]